MIHKLCSQPGHPWIRGFRPLLALILEPIPGVDLRPQALLPGRPLWGSALRCPLSSTCPQHTAGPARTRGWEQGWRSQQAERKRQGEKAPLVDKCKARLHSPLFFLQISSVCISQTHSESHYHDRCEAITPRCLLSLSRVS